MLHAIEIPTDRYRFCVLWPLFILLVVLIGIEVKTSVIPDTILLPAGLYLMIMAAWSGPLRWWRYPLTLLSIILALCALAVTCHHLFGRETIGGGAIKLMAVVGASVGLAIGFETVALCLLAITAVLVLTNISLLPSSPIIAVALYITIGRRYGVNFLIARKRQPVPASE